VMHDTLQRLPASLTKLALRTIWWKDRTGPPVVESSSTARLRQLSGLVQLEFQGIRVRDVTGLLGGLSQLTSLRLGSDW
jgi:hypothetical protein